MGILDGIKLFSGSGEPAAPESTQGESGVAIGISATAREAAKEQLQSAAPRRGRPRKDATIGEGNRGTLSPELQAELARSIEGLYDPRAWGSLLAAPGDVALAVTGNKRWDISANERATLGATGSAVARVMMIQNPKGLAIFMLAAALSSVYLPRLSEELRERQKKPSEKKPDEKQ